MSLLLTHMLVIFRKTKHFIFYLLTSDLPRGPIKNNSMKKLAAKTLLEILPEEMSKSLEKKLKEQNGCPDFLTLVGMVTYYG